MSVTECVHGVNTSVYVGRTWVYDMKEVVIIYVLSLVIVFFLSLID